jgi:glycosyltransferase involved in cell wall biosynthesis
VLAEAMAAGVPVVAADSGAIPEVVGEDGLLFRSGDWMRLAEILASNPAEGGTRDRASRYSLDAAAERLASAYERVLGE